MIDTVHVTCGLSKGPCRQKETWWWNEGVAEAVKENCGNWKKEQVSQLKQGLADRTAKTAVSVAI